jgi:hypothetical protein
MVKMVESAEEFKALKMGDKPVRALPGSAPRFEDTDVRGTKRSRTKSVFFPRARGFFVARVAIGGSVVTPALGSRARTAPPRASLPADFARARPRSRSPRQEVDAARSRIGLRFERTPAVASFRE